MKHYMCRRCIDAIRSRGEQIFVSPLDYWDFDRPEEIVCEWCEEETEDLYEVM